jgi:phosphoserine phosphatase RsbU/P
MRILIAEDDLTSRCVLSAVLERSGHEVVATTDGEGAWEVLQRPDAPRLVILDWMMPGMDGLEVCRRVRDLRTDNPPYILMLTSLGDAEHVAAGLEAGANDYLAKPFHHVELRARILAGARLLALQDRLVAQADALRTALSQVRTLRGIIPICSSCKRIREDSDYWRRVEEYVSAHTEAVFSHGLCPECADRLYPGWDAPSPTSLPQAP